MISRTTLRAGMLGAAIGAVVFVAPHSAAAHDRAAVEAVTRAAQKYNDVKIALAEGYIPAPPGNCVSAGSEGLPAAWGGMGIHYINPALLKITSVDPIVDGESTYTDFMKPAILLYEPQADGSLVLVGIENLVFKAAWEAAGHKAPPTFAGRSWDMMVDNPDTPQHEAHHFADHYDQHIYFRKSPVREGELLPFNPSVSCEHQKQ